MTNKENTINALYNILETICGYDEIEEEYIRVESFVNDKDVECILDFIKNVEE